jgi:uncharacterized membrane protein
MPSFKQLVETAGLAIEAAGVTILVIGFLLATAKTLPAALSGDQDWYRRYRKSLGRVILLGLEFLVAADIIRTVAVEPTLQRALALAIIVLIRTFLRMSIQVELEGKWPWHAGDQNR